MWIFSYISIATSAAAAAAVADLRGVSLVHACDSAVARGCVHLWAMVAVGVTNGRLLATAKG